MQLKLLCVILFAMMMQPAMAKVWYVGTWTGRPAEDIKTSIDEAITAAASNDEIWIAGGEYQIGSGGINYNAAKNLKFYGSFTGTEFSIEERGKVVGGEEWEFQSPTVLKMTAGSTCIWVNNAGITATFDGLTLDGDNISGTRGIGGGAWSELFVTRCIIKNNNISNAYGVGILGKNKITVDYCLITNNAATKPSSSSKWGGGICILAANSSVKHSVVSNNSYTDSGGGIGIDNVGGVVVSDCRIMGNTTTSSGGGVIGYQLADIHNCLIEGNTATTGGGIYFRCYSGTGIAYNNIVAGNTATTGDGGGIYMQDTSGKYISLYNNIIAGNTGNNGLYSAGGYSKIINNIFYDNKTVGGTLTNIAYNAANSNGAFNNNLYDGAMVVNLTPADCITETDGAKIFADYDVGDYSHAANSPAINAGTSSGITLPDTDFAGNPRVTGDAVDVGAYEQPDEYPVTLKMLKIDGVAIDGFSAGKTEYNVVLLAAATAYPSIAVEATETSAMVSALAYNPTVFDPDGTNVVSFTVTNGSNSAGYTLTFTVDKMTAISDLILTRIRADKLTREVADLNADVANFLSLMQTDGSFSDCHYVSIARNDSEVLNHLIRLREMGIAYTNPGSAYFESGDLYVKIVKGFEFWYSKNWTDLNWWQNRIGHPHRLGEAFIAMYGGKKDIREEAVFANLVTRWRSNMGDPDTPNDATTAGANKCDIAMHWIYRSCLTRNEADLAKAADRSFLIIDFTTGEGLQHDWSYRQHGSQLYIGGYGTEFVQLVTRQASYFAGTKYALSGEKLDILSQFVRNTYLKVIRGQRMNFSVLGRGVTRTNSTNQSGFTTVLDMMASVDAAHAGEYNAAIKRLKAEEASSYALLPSQTHYYRSEYTLQQRPEYTFDIRMASSRMARDEYDINENREGFFLSDGATGIFVDGEEYGSILPFWNWKKIPGTTIPDLAVMRRADSYIFSGRSSYAGGVTDGRYGVTAFDMLNDQALFAYNDDDGYSGTPNNSGTRMSALDFGAKKSWFIFDNEIVCLGAGIYSGHDEPVFTTVNQCRRVGNPVVSINSAEQNRGAGVQEYDNVDWVLNDKVAYFFPEKPSVYVANETQTGSWHDINNNGSNNAITGDLFTLWFDHGVKPSKAKYAYIIVPNVNSVNEAKAYPVSDIEILANNDTVQAVYHRGLNMYGLAFFREGTFNSDGLVVDADAGCVMMIKDADTDELTVWVSDPQKQASPIKLGIKTPILSEMKAVTYQNPASPHQGNSQEFKVNDETPEYTGKDVLLDRTGWIIIASSEGPVDATVAPLGDYPEYIIDGDNRSAFLFVKPNKSYGGVTVPSGTKPWFMIDLKQSRDMTYLVYRHRDYSNTTTALRASKGSFYGKNTESEEFQPIIENFDMATDVAEIRIDFPQKVSYRYVKFVYEAWDANNGSTIQISEFNLGNTLLFEEETTTALPELKGIPQLSICPNPVKAGQAFTIRLNNEFSDAIIGIYSVTGVKLDEKKANGNFVEQVINRQGMYIVTVKKNAETYTFKVVVE